MPREISDDEYNWLQGRRQVADFVESIYNDPALSRDAKRLIKRKYPNLPIPDYDLDERLDKVNARIDEDKQAREARERRDKDEAKFLEQRQNTQKQWGFTDEAMLDLEKMMVERNIGDYEVAAQYKAAKSPRPSDPAAAHDAQYWNHREKPDFNDIARDPEAWGRKEIMKAIHADSQRAKSQTF